MSQLSVDRESWSVDEAILVGKRLEEFRLAWLEEPVMADDVDGYKRVAEALDMPVVGGENNFCLPDLQPFIDLGTIPILQPDIMRCGYTELRRIADQAHKAGITIAPHLFPELSTHLLASIPNPSWIEYMGWYDHLWVEPVLPESGTMTPPDRPGHGLDFKPELFTDCPYRP